MSNGHIKLANIILGQIKAGVDEKGTTGGTQCMMCWAFENPRFLIGEKYGEDYQLGGLVFAVSGFKFKGLVFVRLMANDTYTVEFQANKGGSLVIEKSYKQIYCDGLTALIDSYVESGS